MESMTYLAWGAKRLPFTLLWPFTLLGGGFLLPSCLEREPVPAQPKTSNVLVRPIASRAVDKVDLLFVIDNSRSMTDKQKILKDAVPLMVERLTVPDCVERDAEGVVIGRSRATRPSSPFAQPSCEGNRVLEFAPVRDLHVGVITSSLGDRGTGACEGDCGNDKAHLLARTAREGVPDPHGTGFLVYRPLAPDEAKGLPVEGDFDRFQADLARQIELVGEDGCGFESPLEAAYRFLVDPNPPAQVLVDAATKATVSEGVDQELLTQRSAFLRPDSLLSVVILTDENDCSISSGEAHFTSSKTSHSLTRSGVLPVATRACALNPNNPCCTSCQATQVPEGCEDPNALDVCTGQGQPQHEAENDRANLRCFAGKQRFGLDLLYPVSRYIEGFSAPEILDVRNGTYVDNPLFGPGRDKSLVYLAGIVGVPWQGLATSETLATPDTLRLKSAAALHAADIATTSGQISAFDLMLGSPGKNPDQPECQTGTSPECGQTPIPPSNPFMVESIEEREGVHPLLGISVDSEGARAINGHEYDANAPSERFKGEAARNDLQYACIFPAGALRRITCLHQRQLRLFFRLESGEAALPSKRRCALRSRSALRQSLPRDSGAAGTLRPW